MVRSSSSFWFDAELVVGQLLSNYCDVLRDAFLDLDVCVVGLAVRVYFRAFQRLVLQFPQPCAQ